MSALIITDLQYDFMPGGALPVRGADELIPLANDLAARFAVVVATQDWHPPSHISFASTHIAATAGDRVQTAVGLQRLWPDHCVQNTPGAALVRGLDRSLIQEVFQKGADGAIDEFSVFLDNSGRATALRQYLADRGVASVYLMGVATDYCIRASAIDAASLGLDTHVILDACRGIEQFPGDVERAMRDMESAGVKVVTSMTLLEELTAV